MKQRSYLRGAVIFSLALAAFVGEVRPALGCVVVATEYTVGPDFIVVVGNDHEPAADVQVEIGRDQKTSTGSIVAKGRTDPNGRFRVKGLPLGDYRLSVGKDTVFGDFALLKVRGADARERKGRIEMGWAPEGRLRIGRFRGVLRDSEFDPKTEKFVAGRPLVGAGIKVRDARSLKVVARARTEAMGMFDVGPLPVGFYTADFVEGRMALEIVKSDVEFAAGVELAIESTDCGLMHSASAIGFPDKEKTKP